MAPHHPTILQIIPELDTGGAELSTIEIADAIVSAGGRAVVLSQGGRLAQRVSDVGGEHINFPAATKNPIQLWRNAQQIATLIKDEGVALVHARSRAPAWSALAAARRTKTPFVTTYHGAYNERSKLKNVYNSVMARGDIIIANSQYTSALIQKRYGTPPKKIRVIYRGVDPHLYEKENVPQDRLDDLRSAWDIKPGQSIILNVARLTEWKGQRTIIDAVRKLNMQGDLKDWVVILAGDDQGRSGYKRQLEQQITEANLGDQVRLVGHVSDVPAALALSLLAVVASTEPEAFGRAAVEAQAAGCPVIATNIGAPPETVRAGPDCPNNERTGWLVPPGDTDKLVEALREGLGLTSQERNEIGRRARIHVAGAFSLAAMKQQTLQVYDELLGTQLARNGKK